MRIVVTILGMLIVLSTAAACDVSNAQMSLDGPDTIAKDEDAWYQVTITNLPPAGVVQYYPYVNLNDDEFIDEEELIGGFIRIVPVDSDGVSTRWFLLNPAEFFQSRELAVPDITTVEVYAQLYVSPDNIFAIGTVSKDLKITE